MTTTVRCLLLAVLYFRGSVVFSHIHGDFMKLVADKWPRHYRESPYLPQSEYIAPFLGSDTDDAMVYEEKVRDWLSAFNEGYRQIRHEAALVNWNYNTNITVANAEKVAEQGVKRSSWMQPWRREAQKVDMNRVRDPFLRRQMSFIRRGSSHVDPALTREVIHIHSKMQEIYNTGKVCVANGTCYSGEPQLARFMQTTRDYDQLLWAWKAWRDQVGPVIRPLYTQFIELSNEEAQILGYNDMGELWRHELDSDNLEGKMENLFAQVKPLYKQLHAYVRFHLCRLYGKNRINSRGPIPAHVLGNMWAQQWDSLYYLMIPYPQHNIPDVTSAMKAQGYTVKHMFRLAEDFFLSIGLDAMTKEFWTRSVLEKPKDSRQISCHGSATNFFDGCDYRMCTEVSEQDLYTVHHEMGHVEYFMAYRHLPIIFQDGANSAFHEAIGETIHYSVLTPGHLQRLRLLKPAPITYETDINYLMKQALLKIPLMPFSLILDKWRWAVFNNRISCEDYTKGWWALRLKYQGVVPPIVRTEEDFDPGSKYHIPDNTPYIRYYLSSFMQVQFHEALCKCKSNGHLGEALHHCDIYGSAEAGAKLKAMLSLGTSQSWPATLYMMTGERQVSAKSLLRYYAPLYDWLVEENNRLGNYIGWDERDPRHDNPDGEFYERDLDNEINNPPLP